MTTTTTLPVRYSWLVRRELWEHKLVTWAPLILALVIIGSVLAAYLSHGQVVLDFDADDTAMFRQAASTGKFELMVAGGLTLVSIAFLILANGLQIFYAADALYAERAQRTILFWKSLPVSDAQAVLSKLLVASVVAPVVAWAMALLTEVVLVAVLSPQFRDVPGALAALWSPSAWGYSLYMTLYVLASASIWYLPVIAWTLLVSAWLPLARGMRLGRSPLMVSILMPMALMLVERIVLHSRHLYDIVVDRAFFRGYPLALHMDSVTFNSGRMQDLNGGVGMLASHIVRPLAFFSAPSVWLGVVASAVMLAGAVYCRRRSENRG